MKIKSLILTTALVLAAIAPAAMAQTNQTSKVETKEQRDARMAWFREAKFGMFIHWGVYSVPAGFYHDKPVAGIGEWIMNKGKIPMAEYQQFAKEFNPIKFDADEWVKIAKDAGMKYIVITSKHHDGFAMFDTKASPWNIVQTTPYGRDPLKALAAACQKQGIKLGFYYSQAQDWNNGGSAAGGKWDPAQQHDMDDYIDKVAVPQVKEILSNYGEFPAVLWWDTPIDMNRARAQKLYDAVEQLRPNIIMNNRLGGGFKGDTETPEQFVPATGFPGRDWETCMTMNDTWGFKSDDQNFKPVAMLIRNLCDIASKGGNYLLNVGPTSSGIIPPPEVDRLRAIGAWMRVNHAAIYGTTASPFTRLTWGRCTKTVSANGGTLYLQVFDWPADGQLVVPGLASKITGAQILATGKKLSTQATNGNVVITLPAQAPDSSVSVIALKFTGPLQVERVLPQPLADGRIQLGAEWADIHNNLRAHAQMEGKGDSAKITQWVVPDSRVSWNFNATHAGSFTVTADVAGAGGGRLTLLLGDQSVPAEVPAGGSARRNVKLGTVVIPEPGECQLELKPAVKNWKGFDLHSLTLTPQPAGTAQP